MSRLVKVRGIIIAASKTRAKATALTVQCKDCKNVKVIPCRPGLSGVMIPRSCDQVTQVLNRWLTGQLHYLLLLCHFLCDNKTIIW